jgi:hypothetical protein
MPPSNQVANDPGMELAETLLSGLRAETPGEQIVSIPRERVAYLPGLISYRVNALVTSIGRQQRGFVCLGKSAAGTCSSSKASNTPKRARTTKRERGGRPCS